MLEAHSSATPTETAGSVIYGLHPVMEALQASPNRIRKIVVRADSSNANVQEIIRLARQAGIKVLHDGHAARQKRRWPPASQGVLAETEPFVYTDMLELPAADGPMDAILALDGVTDPRNLGAILRVAEAVRLRGVLIPKNRAAEITPAAVKAASGAVSYVNVCRVTNLSDALKDLKKSGYWIVGLEEGSGKTLWDVPHLDKVVLVAGGEGGGMRRLIREQCDWIASIPMWGRVASLNVSVAVAVAFYLLIVLRKTAAETELDPDTLQAAKKRG
jgi:23S rRNA (guanosine2251-2'-O)-methyltransferase